MNLPFRYGGALCSRAAVVIASSPERVQEPPVTEWEHQGRPNNAFRGVRPQSLENYAQTCTVVWVPIKRGDGFAPGLPRKMDLRDVQLLATPSSSEAIPARAPVRGWTSRHIGRCRSQPIHSIPEGRDLANKFERLWPRGAECIPATPRAASFHWVAPAIVLEVTRRPSPRCCSASHSTVTGNSSVIRPCGTATRDWPRGPKYVSVRPISQRPDLYRLVGTL
jgi:hypothetical protein